MFTEPIIRWAGYGLANPSFIKCKNIHNIETSRLFQKMGIMDGYEFMNLIERIEFITRPSCDIKSLHRELLYLVKRQYGMIKEFPPLSTQSRKDRILSKK